MAPYYTNKKKKPIRRRHSYVEDENGNLVQVEPIRKRRKNTLTRPHRILIRIINSLNLKWIDEKRFGRYSIDVYLPDYNIAVECDGLYFHTLPGVPEKDKRRDKELLEKYGVVTLRFTDEEINTNKKYVLKKIKEFIDEKEKN